MDNLANLLFGFHSAERDEREGDLPMAIAQKFATHQSSIWHWLWEGGRGGEAHNSLPLDKNV